MTNNLPLLVRYYPVFVMQDSPNYLFQKIQNLVRANHSFSFCENGFKLNFSEVFTVIRTLCSGLLCDRQNLDDWNMNNERGCGYYAMHFRRSSIVNPHDIILTNVTSPSKETISINSFSSNKFTKLYLSLYLSPSINLSQLDITAPEYFNIMEPMQNMVGYINRNRGLTATQWYKHGTINDRTLEEKNNSATSYNNSNADNQANASEINHRVV